MRSFGEILQHYREKRGFTRKALVDGICSESTLFRIEKGDVIPGMYTVEQLCSKLNIPMSVLFNEQNKYEYNSILSLKQRCRKHVYDKNYVELSVELSKLKSEVDKTNKYNDKLFIIWHEAIILHKLNSQTKNAKELLLINLPEELVLEVEIAILNTLGLICCSLEEDDEALHYFHKAYTEVQDIVHIEDQTLYVRIVYNYASRLYYLGYYEQVIDLANQLITYLRINHLFYMRGRILHMLGKTYEKMNDYDMAKGYLNRAISAFTFDGLSNYRKRTEKDLDMIRLELIDKTF